MIKSWNDDFKRSEINYIAALNYYKSNNFSYISLGDCEELWKFPAEKILPANEPSLTAEAAFQPDDFYKTFGNHDIMWKNKADVFLLLRKYFPHPLTMYEGVFSSTHRRREKPKCFYDTWPPGRSDE